MFGLRGSRKGAENGTDDAADAPYSRFSGVTPGSQSTRTKYSRFDTSTGANRRRPPVEQKAPPPAQPAEAPKPLHIQRIADLYSEDPIPAAVLRRALPNRFKRMEQHGIRVRASLVRHDSEASDPLFD